MNEHDLIANISSSDTNLLISTLFRLGSEKFSEPSPLVMEKVAELISNPDQDVRHRAIFTIGIHWLYRPALPKIIEVLHNIHEDPIVRTCASTAVGSIAHADETVRKWALFELAKIVTNANTPQEVRDVAYTSALWAAHRITPDEYAKRSISDIRSDVDWDWLAASLRDHNHT